MSALDRFYCIALLLPQIRLRNYFDDEELFLRPYSDRNLTVRNLTKPNFEKSIISRFFLLVGMKYLFQSGLSCFVTTIDSLKPQLYYLLLGIDMKLVEKLGRYVWEFYIPLHSLLDFMNCLEFIWML